MLESSIFLCTPRCFGYLTFFCSFNYFIETCVKQNAELVYFFRVLKIILGVRKQVTSTILCLTITIIKSHHVLLRFELCLDQFDSVTSHVISFLFLPADVSYSNSTAPTVDVIRSLLFVNHLLYFRAYSLYIYIFEANMITDFCSAR